MKNQKEIAIQTLMKDKGINNNTIDFFIEMLRTFEKTDVITSTSKKLAKNYGCSERSIQRYIKVLRDHNLIHVKPHYNNDEPSKPYIEKNEYSKTRGTLRLERKADGYSVRHKTVFFEQGAN